MRVHDSVCVMDTRDDNNCDLVHCSYSSINAWLENVFPELQVL